MMRNVEGMSSVVKLNATSLRRSKGKMQLSADKKRSKRCRKDAFKMNNRKRSKMLSKKRKWRQKSSGKIKTKFVSKS